MSGVALGALAGIGFGLFQAVNRRANASVDVYRATFVLLAIGAVLLTAVSLATEDVAMVLHAPRASLVAFAAAAFIHFFLGWTFLGLSQQRLGAARTGALVGTTPLFGALAAALVLGEWLTGVQIAGLLIVVAGVAAVAMSRRKTGVPAVAGSASGIAFALGTAACWSVSPLLIRTGLEGLPSPLLGVTVGIAVAALAYGIAMAIVRRGPREPLTRPTLGLLVIAGTLVGLSIWLQWMAYDLARVAVVLAMLQLAAPVVVLVSPLVSGDPVERGGISLWMGLLLIVGGSVLLVLNR